MPRITTTQPYDPAAADALHADLARARSASCPEERSMIEDGIVRDLLPMAWGLARRYADRGADPEDLRSVAALALLKAIRGFEPSLGSFRPYATATILGDIKKHFRDHCWDVRPTRRIQELQAEIVQLTGERTQDHASVRPQALAECLGVDTSDVTEALTAFGLFAMRSLDAPGPRGDSPLRDRVVADDHEIEAVEHRLTATAACRHLPQEDRELLRMRFVDHMTQQQIADTLGVNQVHVSRRLGRVLRTLRNRLETDPAAAPAPRRPLRRVS